MLADMKLGRVRPTSKQRAAAPRLRDFLTKPLPPAPTSFHGADGAAISMLGNDRYGCCVVAGAGNYRAVRAAVLKQPAPPTTTEAVVAQYFKSTGGGDDGLVETEFLNAAKNGVELGGPTWMDATWATVSGADVDACRSLISIFGALYLGVELPKDAQHQKIWTPTTGRNGAPGGWGGHCLLWSGYDDQQDDLVTWGTVQKASLDWLGEYGDEFHVIVDADSAAIAGVDFESLVLYANEVAVG